MKTADEIYREMIETFTRETGMEPDGAGEMAVRMYALAVQVYGLYQEAEWTRRQCFPQTATGEELDKHAWLRGISRNPASRAVGTLRFSVSTAPETDLPIPQGTVCMTAGLVRFETTQAGVLKAGETAAEVPAQAVLAGPGGNTPAGTIRTMAVAPTGIAACTNPAAFSGGWAEEDDETLRARVLDSYQNQPNGVNEAYYAQQALARIQREMHLATAREEGLTGLCHLLGCLAEGEPDQLRQTLAALLRVGSGSFTLAAVNDAVRGCGISALVEETEDPLKLTVSFPDTGGVPDDFARRQQVIEKLLPCHVLVEYQFQYMTWTLLEGRFLSWEQLEETGATWKTFEAQTL